MLDVGIEVGVKMIADPDVAGEGDERRNERPFADGDIVHLDCVGGAHFEKGDPLSAAPFDHLLPRPRRAIATATERRFAGVDANCSIRGR